MAAASTQNITISKKERDRLPKLSELRGILFKYCKDNNSKNFTKYIYQLIDDNDVNYAIFIYNFVLKEYNEFYSDMKLYTQSTNNESYLLSKYDQRKVSTFLNEIKFEDQKEMIKSNSTITISKEDIKKDIISIIRRICPLIQNIVKIQEYIQSRQALKFLQAELELERELTNNNVKNMMDNDDFNFNPINDPPPRLLLTTN